jgi:hypothetical protein
MSGVSWVSHNDITCSQRVDDTFTSDNDDYTPASTALYIVSSSSVINNITVSP